MDSELITEFTPNLILPDTPDHTYIEFCKELDEFRREFGFAKTEEKQIDLVDQWQDAGNPIPEDIKQAIPIDLYCWPQRPDKPWLPRGPINEIQKTPWFYLPEVMGYHKHPQSLLCLMGGSRGGKSLDKLTPVVLYNGTIKTASEIQVGDLLMGPDGKPRQVMSLGRGVEMRYRITPNKGDSFICNESHILSLKTSGWRVRTYNTPTGRKEETSTGEIVNMQLREYLALSDRNKEALKSWKSGPIEFDKGKPTTINPYFLGLWLAEGHKNNTAITSPEPEIKTFIHDYAKSLGLTVSTYSKGIATDYRISGLAGVKESNGLLNKLRSYGLLFNKHIPLDYKRASREQRLELLAGLLDGDGYLANERFYEIMQKVKTLADDIVFLARSLGFGVTIKPVDKYCTYKGEKRGGTYYRINIFGHLEEIPLRVERKKFKAKLQHRTDHLVTGFKVEPLEEGDYYGFEIERLPGDLDHNDQDHLFLLGDFTVTHNSVGVCAHNTECLWTFPGVHILIAGKSFSHLELSALLDYEKLFSYGGGSWNHWVLKRKAPPNKSRRTVEFINGSRLTFLGVEDPYATLSTGYSIIHMEEPQRLKAFTTVFSSLVTRIANTNAPFTQIAMTLNPVEGIDVMRTHWNLDQLMPGYQGERGPIGALCDCQMCQRCIKENALFEYIDGECPKCGSKKGNDCPGSQEWQQAFLVNSDDNPTVHSTYDQGMRLLMGKDEFQKLSRGLITDHRKGLCYKTYSISNILSSRRELDLDKEVIWTMDLNIDPAMSALVQIDEGRTKDEDKVFVIDELVVPDADEEDVALAFCERYAGHEFKKVIMYGDPAIYYGKTKKKAHRYHVIQNILESRGFVTELRARRTQYSVQYRIDSVSHMLKAIMPNGEPIMRLYINPDLTWTRLSFQKVQWDDKGEKEDDKIDGHFSDILHPVGLTHITAAIGYHIVQDYPIIDPKLVGTRGYKFAQNLVTGKMVSFEGGRPMIYKPVSNEEFQTKLLSLDGDEDFQNYRQQVRERPLISTPSGSKEAIASARVPGMSNRKDSFWGRFR